MPTLKQQIDSKLAEFDITFPIGCEVWVLERHKHIIQSVLYQALKDIAIEAVKEIEVPKFNNVDSYENGHNACVSLMELKKTKIIESL